ncbi:MAG: DUF488 domain-containing protein [Nanoarchaeota archaeon]|nr:DUF488 domain-containing protein [Nanoarchaeota archaeon]
MKIYTIGFTKKSLGEFIDLLKKNGVQKVVDIRLNPSSQLSGFAIQRDLKYTLKRESIGYEHILELAPDEPLLEKYRKDKNWAEYEKSFSKLMERRNAKEILKKLLSEGKTLCLLCSEDKANKCHRRLVAELLDKDVEIIHL